MIDVVGKRGWYFLISGLLMLAALISMMAPPGWITLDSGLRAGIDFSSGSVMNVSFSQPVEEDHIRERMDELGHTEALIQRIGGTNFFIRTEVLEEAVGDGLSEREVIERDLEKFLGMYASLNSFVELVAKTQQREEPIRRWPPRAGEQLLV